MDNKEICKQLGELMQLDIDAAHAYGQAIQEIEEPKIRRHLDEYRSDHERHINALAEMIRKLGEKPPEHSRDLKGFLIEGFTAIRSATGTEGALKAMRTNEQLTNKNYSQAVSKDFPADVKSLLQKNYSDEQRHLAYVERALTERLWEKATV